MTSQCMLGESVSFDEIVVTFRIIKLSFQQLITYEFPFLLASIDFQERLLTSQLVNFEYLDQICCGRTTVRVEVHRYLSQRRRSSLFLSLGVISPSNLLQPGGELSHSTDLKPSEVAEASTVEEQVNSTREVPPRFSHRPKMQAQQGQRKTSGRSMSVHVCMQQEYTQFVCSSQRSKILHAFTFSFCRFHYYYYFSQFLAE